MSELKYIRSKSKRERLNYTDVSEFTYNEILFQVKAVSVLNQAEQNEQAKSRKIHRLLHQAVVKAITSNCKVWIHISWRSKVNESLKSLTEASVTGLMRKI